MPGLVANVKANEAAISRLAVRVKRGEKVTWPVKVGPFRFLRGQGDEDGVFFSTADESEGDWGIEWATGALRMYNAEVRPVSKDLYLISDE